MRAYTSLSLILLVVVSCSPGRDASGSRAGPPQVVYSQHIEAGGKAPPAGTMTNPYTGDSASARAGEQLFSSMNCDGCHGGPPTGFVGPSLVDGRWRYGGADGAIYQSIFYGRPRGMPAYGGLLSEDMVWKLVTYLKALPVPVDMATESWASQ